MSSELWSRLKVNCFEWLRLFWFNTCFCWIQFFRLIKIYITMGTDFDLILLPLIDDPYQPETEEIDWDEDDVPDLVPTE